MPTAAGTVSSGFSTRVAVTDISSSAVCVASFAIESGDIDTVIIAVANGKV
jgi:hypothetical protein